MKFLSGVYTAVSGSVGGLTYAHNAGGMYARARGMPTNPNTPYQQAVRQILLNLSAGWGQLSSGTRTWWNDYGKDCTLPDAFGDPMRISGLAWYCRNNAARVQAGLPVVSTPPNTCSQGDFTDPTLGVISAAAGTVSFEFTATDDWANEDDAAMLVYISRPAAPSINYFKGPYRYADAVLGDATTPPTSPQVIELPFFVQEGQRVFVRVTVTRADGRYAGPFRAFGPVSA